MGSRVCLGEWLGRFWKSDVGTDSKGSSEEFGPDLWTVGSEQRPLRRRVTDQV